MPGGAPCGSGGAVADDLVHVVLEGGEFVGAWRRGLGVVVQVEVRLQPNLEPPAHGPVAAQALAELFERTIRASWQGTDRMGR